MAIPWAVALAGLLHAVQPGASPFERGVESLRRGDLSDAERLFEEVLSRTPEHAPSAIYLARILRQMNRPAEAETVLVNALALRPKGIALLNELGTLLLEERRLEEAERTFDLAAAEHPDNVRATTGVVESRLALGRGESALELAREALGRSPDRGQLHWLEARVEAALGRYEQALASLGRAHALLEAEEDPTPLRSSIERTEGFVLLALNRDAQALSTLERVLETHPADAEAQFAIGELHFRGGRLPEARAAFEKVPSGFASSGAAELYLGDIALLEVRLDAAVSHYVLAAERGVPEARRKKAEALLKLGRLEEAKTALERALALDPEDAESHYLLARTALDAGDPAAALVPLREARRLRPHHAPTRYLLGTTLSALGLDDEARREIETFRELKRFDDEAERLSRMLVERPDDVDAFLGLAGLYVAHGRDDEALPLLAKARALAPGDAELGYRHAIALARAGRGDDARAALAEAARLDPNHTLRDEAETALGRPSAK